MFDRDAVGSDTRAGACGARAGEGQNAGGEPAGGEPAGGCEPRKPPAKIRRLDDGQLPREWTQQLYSTDGAHRVECKFSNSRDYECGIMQDPTHLVDVPDLPQAWPRADGLGSSVVGGGQAGTHAGANTVHLPCGHVFSPCALALHFLVQDMRCPICRVGCKTRMNIACVPGDIRPIYAKKMEQLEEAAGGDVDTTGILEVFTNMHLQVILRFRRQSSRTPRSNVHAESLIHSRLILREEDIATHMHAIQQLSEQGGAPAPAPADAPADADAPAPADADAPAPADADAPAPAGHASVMGLFGTHRSFQRIIQSILERQDASSNVVFVLQHPLMPLEISSSEMSVQSAHAALFGVHSGQVQGPVSIPLFCSAISGVEPIAHVHSAFNPTHNTANISVGINLRVMLDMSVYVTQVLDHLSGLADED